MVDRVSLSLKAGEALSIVGESGCGKSTILKAVMRVLPENGKIEGGSVLFKGQDIYGLPAKAWRQVTGHHMVMLFQQPGGYLNPIRTIGRQFSDFLSAHGMEEKKIHGLALESLEKAGLPEGERILSSYAFQLSGGMRQKVAASMILSLNPELIVMDEPTSALDSASVINFLNLVKTYASDGAAILFVTHNIRAASYLSERIIVMHKGRFLEEGNREELRLHSRNAYTRELFRAVPDLR